MIEGFVGIRFKDGGRDRSGADCWGLVRLYLQETFGLTLPTYSETPVADLTGSQRAINEAMTNGAWRKVDRSELRHGDVALLWCYEPDGTGRPVRTRRHVGVITADPKKMLHVEDGTDSVIVPLSHVSVRSRLESFWRPRALE